MPSSLPNAVSDSTIRVLLIDADRGARDAAAMILAGCFAQSPDLALAASGEAARDLLRGSRCDLVLADLGTVAGMGQNIDASVRRLVKLSGDALLIVLSNDGAVSTALGALRAGAHDHLAKPLAAASFGARIAGLALRHGKPGLQNGLAHPAIADAHPNNDWTRSLPANGVEVAAPIVEPLGQILPMWQQEQQIIEAAIARCAGNVALAAAALQLSPSTLYRKRQAWAETGNTDRGAA